MYIHGKRPKNMERENIMYNSVPNNIQQSFASNAAQITRVMPLKSSHVNQIITISCMVFYGHIHQMYLSLSLSLTDAVTIGDVKTWAKDPTVMVTSTTCIT